MKVLVACEFSGIVRDAFLERGHDAISCDFYPSLSKREGGKHHQGDVLSFLQQENFDLLIAHPPCTHLCVSGARWFKEKRKLQDEATIFFIRLALANVSRIAIENPIGIMSQRYRKPDQIIQPWQFGHSETKAICLWLKNLPLLQPTKIMQTRNAVVHHMPPSKERGLLRSIFYKGIANAMADQWTLENEVPTPSRMGREPLDRSTA